MTERNWQLRFGFDGETSRYVSNDDYVIATSPLPGLIHLLGPASHDLDGTEPSGVGPKRDLIAVAEIGDWAAIYQMFTQPENVVQMMGQAT